MGKLFANWGLLSHTYISFVQTRLIRIRYTFIIFKNFVNLKTNKRGT